MRGAKDDAALKADMSLIVCAGGGERDYEVDGQILTQIPHQADQGAFLNERLMSDVRPTLFLAQLSNLLAGNIAIVHGVTGASRTFMGEEQAGIDAIRIAHARIRAGQAEIVLVGGSFNGERPDSLMLYEMGGVLWKQTFCSGLSRGPNAAVASFSARAAASSCWNRARTLKGAGPGSLRGSMMSAQISPVASPAPRRRCSKNSGRRSLPAPMPW